MIELRPYQQDALDSILDYWQSGGGNPLVSLATGLGKSVIIAELTRRMVEDYPDMRILNIVHVRELVAQNFQALLRLWPGAPAGLWSTGLGRKDGHHRITYASVQSVFRNAAKLGPRDLVIIDECHLVPAAGEGMYRRLLDDLREMQPDARVAGFTATPFRMDSGRLDTGDGRLFDSTVYTYDVGAGIRDGWLAPLKSRASATEIPVDAVARRGGEFVPGALESAADTDDITRAAVQEMLRYGADRRSWLVFCSGVRHAAHVCEAIVAAGIPAATVTGQTRTSERDARIRDFKAGRIRALTNAQVLTTGFDAPAVDMIVFLRPTLSTGLYLQMVGRGTRKAEGKSDCLVLDFAGNIRRHGPVDVIAPPDRRPRKNQDNDEARAALDSVRAKECPSCEAMVGLAARSCQWCGHEFPAPEPRHEENADDAPILSTERPEPPEELPVFSWTARRHCKNGSPDSLRVDYIAGFSRVSEWVCLEHAGFAGQKAARWWWEHGGGETPDSVEGALARFPTLTCPAKIRVRQHGKYANIVSRTFETAALAAYPISSLGRSRPR